MAYKNTFRSLSLSLLLITSMLPAMKLEYENITKGEAGNVQKTNTGNTLKQMLLSNVVKKNKNNSTDKYFIKTLRAFQRCQKIDQVNVSKNKLQGAAASVLANLFSNNDNITVFDASGNKFNDEDVQEMLQELSPQNITSLCLSHNPLTKKSIKAISPFIDSGNIQEFSIGGTKIDPSDLAHMMRNYQVLTHLTHLDISNAQLDHLLIAKIARGLVNCTNITYFDCSNNKINLEGISALVIALQKQHHLHTLKLENTNIGDKGLEIVCESLEASQNDNLTLLDISNNQLTNKCSQALAPQLTQQKQLSHFNIARNKINDAGIIPILIALQDKPIKYLSLHHTDIGDNCINDINRVTENNTILEVFDASNTKINDLSKIILGKNNNLTSENYYAPLSASTSEKERDE